MRLVWNKKYWIFFFLLSLCLMLHSDEITFLYMAQAGFQPQDVLRQARRFEELTGHKIHMLFPEYEDRHAMISELNQEGKKDSFDIILVDLIWVEELLAEGILSPLPAHLENRIRQGVEPPIYQPFEKHGRMWSMPFNADFQILLSNMDLLQQAGYSQPPQSLEEMVEMAQKVKEEGLVRYPLFESWDNIEALNCEYTWLLHAFGGNFNGMNINSPQGVRTLRFMIDLLDQGLMNPYSLQSDEGFVSDVFLAGDALFVTNWTFIIESLNRDEHALGDQWQPSLIPVSQSIQPRHNSFTICGFEGLSVPSGSNNKEIAWEFIEFLSALDFQKEHVEFLSVWREAWSDPTTRENDPYLDLKREQVMYLAHRPYSADYPRISYILRTNIYRALNGFITPEEALERAQRAIEELP